MFLASVSPSKGFTPISPRGRKGGWRSGVRLVLLCAMASVFASIAAAQPQPQWESTWMASEAPSDSAQFIDQTIREIVHASIGGLQVRVRISNTFGAEPLVLGAAHIALRANRAAIEPGTDRALTFSGQPGISIPPGAMALSDPAPLSVPAESDLAISLYFPRAAPAQTVHPLAVQTSYVSGPGDFTAAPTIENPRRMFSWPFLTGVDVATRKRSSRSCWPGVAGPGAAGATGLRRCARLQQSALQLHHLFRRGALGKNRERGLGVGSRGDRGEDAVDGVFRARGGDMQPASAARHCGAKPISVLQFDGSAVHDL